MKRNLLLVSGVLLTAAAAWLVDAQQLSPRATFYTDDRARIQALVEGWRALEINVLETRAGLAWSFDPINRAVTALRASAGDAAIVSARGPVYAPPAAELALVATAVNDEETALEQFKTDLALLRLSSHHLPIAADALMRHAADNPSLAPTATLRSDVQRYDESPGRELAQRLELAISPLQTLRESLDEPARADLDALLGHARAILDRRERVDRFARALVDSPVRAHLEAARVAYERASRVHGRRLDALRVLAGMLALAGLFVLMSAVRRRPS